MTALDPRANRTVVVAVAAALAVAVSVAGLAVTGELAAPPAGLPDSGALIRWGLPAARAVHDLLAAACVGLLVVGAFVVPATPGTDPTRLAGVRLRVVRAGAAAAAAWLAAGVVVLVLTIGDVGGVPLGSAGFGQVAITFVGQLDLGRSLMTSLLVISACATTALLATRAHSAAWAAVMSLLALLPLALAGHASSSNDHQNAVDSLGLHLVGVCVWVGGLVALLLYASRLGGALPQVAARYSTLAGWCFALVAASGLLNAALRLGTPAGLATPYGLLVAGKAAALALLGLAGWRHRGKTLPALANGAGRMAFWRLAAGEVVVMGATIGLAVALSRSAPPQSQDITGDPTAALLGFPAPPPLSAAHLTTAFYLDSLWLTIAVVACGWYLVAARTLRRRGDRWPVMRTVSWVAGCVNLVYFTSGGPSVYGRVLFSMHMLAHMSLTMLVPLLLVLGGPVTLALRTVPARHDGSLGPREVLLAVIHSRLLHLLSRPVVAGGLFAGSLVAFYYTSAFDAALYTHTGHVLMTVHFLATGYLFAWVLVGIDPGPHRPSYPMRLVLLLATLSFHAFFGVALMQSTTVLAADWWAALGRTDYLTLLHDQQVGGGIAWGTGDLPTLGLSIALAIAWSRSDERTARRLDRRADQDGDKARKDYNAQLAQLAQQDAATRRPTDRIRPPGARGG